MGTSKGAKLVQVIRQKLEEMNKVCQGLDEATASKAPAGRWSPKEIISHLIGPEGRRHVSDLQTILTEETPLLEIKAADAYFSGLRQQQSFVELLSQLNEDYSRMAELVAQMPAEQLERKAHIPLFKETPMVEYPTLAMYVMALAEFHLEDHINHMKEILVLLCIDTLKK